MNIFNKIKVLKPEKLKNYKVLSEKTKAIFPCYEYEKLQAVINYLDSLENEEIEKLNFSLPKEGFREKNIVDYFYNQAQKNEWRVG